jgi:hypothetical protein
METKNVGLRIRVDKSLREAFVSACRTEERKASEVLREFMRLYAEQNLNGLQVSLFKSNKSQKAGVK